MGADLLGSSPPVAGSRVAFAAALRGTDAAPLPSRYRTASRSTGGRPGQDGGSLCSAAVVSWNSRSEVSAAEAPRTESMVSSERSGRIAVVAVQVWWALTSSQYNQAEWPST